jgi:hypothetical protein
MDVTFRENEPYYGPTNDTEITLSPFEVQQEGESNGGGILVGSICIPNSNVLPLSDRQSLSQGETTYNHNDNPCHGDMHHNLPSQNIESIMHEDPHNGTQSPDPIYPSSTLEQGENQPSTQPSSHNDLPIALRKPHRSSNIPAHLKDYVGYKHDIANFMSYKNCSSSFQSFIASLDSVSIPTN